MWLLKYVYTPTPTPMKKNKQKKKQQQQKNKVLILFVWELTDKNIDHYTDSHLLTKVKKEGKWIITTKEKDHQKKKKSSFLHY